VKISGAMRHTVYIPKRLGVHVDQPSRADIQRPLNRVVYPPQPATRNLFGHYEAIVEFASRSLVVPLEDDKLRKLV
jgi:hypothetical protein